LRRACVGMDAHLTKVGVEEAFHDSAGGQIKRLTGRA
jgi:hypothetical protein